MTTDRAALAADTSAKQGEREALVADLVKMAGWIADAQMDLEKRQSMDAIEHLNETRRAFVAALRSAITSPQPEALAIVECHLAEADKRSRAEMADNRMDAVRQWRAVHSAFRELRDELVALTPSQPVEADQSLGASLRDQAVGLRPDSLGASPAGTALSAPALRASAPIAGAWQPIETAPTGRVHSPPLHAIVASPLDDGSLYVEEAWWDYERKEWWPANVDATDAHGAPIYPTHWMPLPAPPCARDRDPEGANPAGMSGEAVEPGPSGRAQERGEADAGIKGDGK